MTKIKRSYTINPDLDNAIGRLATRSGLSNSQFVESILRDYGPISKMIMEFQMAEEIPDYQLTNSLKKIPA